MWARRRTTTGPPPVSGEQKGSVVVQVHLRSEAAEPLLTWTDLQAATGYTYDRVDRLVTRLGLTVRRLPHKVVTQAELREALGLPRRVPLGRFAFDDVGDPADDQPDPEPGYSRATSRWAS